jgi:hypothetical protein
LSCRGLVNAGNEALAILRAHMRSRIATMKSRKIYRGGSEYSEDTSAKWIFDVEIEKLRAKIYFLHVEKTKIMLGIC